MKGGRKETAGSEDESEPASMNIDRSTMMVLLYARLKRIATFFANQPGGSFVGPPPSRWLARKLGSSR
jgi:hypothetical protein